MDAFSIPNDGLQFVGAPTFPFVVNHQHLLVLRRCLKADGSPRLVWSCEVCNYTRDATRGTDSPRRSKRRSD